jgi:hypothetical protein
MMWAWYVGFIALAKCWIDHGSTIHADAECRDRVRYLVHVEAFGKLLTIDGQTTYPREGDGQTI